MAFLWRLIQVQFLWKKLKEYREIKLDAITSPSRRPSSRAVAGTGRLRKLYAMLQTEGTPEHEAWAGFRGFLGGIALSWIFFVFCIFALGLSIKRVTWISALISTLLAFLLSFSSLVRCYVLLIVPQLCTKRGRQALTAYALVLAVTGPARNSIHNLRILSNSLACSQEQVKRGMKQVVEMIRQPITAMKTTFRRLQKDIGHVLKPLKDVVTRITKVFKAVFGVIESVTSWLNNVVSVCNKKTGTPYQHCVKSLDDAIADCQLKLGLLQGLCSVVSAVKPLCLPAKAVDLLCGVMDMVSDYLVNVAKRRLAIFRQHISDMLAVSIQVNISQNMTDTASRSVQDVVDGIVREVGKRMAPIKRLTKFVIVIPGAAFLYVIAKAVRYRHKYLKSDHFDNWYLKRELVEIDLARLRLNLPTALPLELYEREIYSQVTSLRLVKGEKKRLVSAFLFLSLTTIQTVTYLAIDYGIYQTLLLIRRQGLAMALSFESATAGVEIEGSGSLADLYKQLGNVFKPPAPSIGFDPVPCLPEPISPNFRRYIQIGVLLLISWLLVFVEPYFLRLRSIVMSHYHPERARIRAIWLHNHIMLSRGPFITFVRNRLRSRLRKSYQNEHPGTFLQRLLHRSAILRKVFGTNIVACHVCASQSPKGAWLKCPAPGCKAIFCTICVEELTRCILCYEPLQTGAHVRAMEAVDSSEESDEESRINHSSESDQYDTEIDNR